MKYFSLLKMGMIILMLSIVGCGGGNSSTTVTSGIEVPVVQSTKVSGIASKGPIIGGTVTAYKIVNNTIGELIVSGKTGADGKYSLDLGSYSGAVLFEISGGTYTDEATGASKSLDAPLHAIVSSTSGTVSVAITPLTELAYQIMKTGTAFSITAINSANNQVASAFKVYDIIKTQPVSPSKSALDALPTSIQGQDQRDYTLALAVFSQVAATKSMTVADTVTYLQNSIVNGSLFTPAAATVIQDAAIKYFDAANLKNTTGVTDPSTTSLVYIGTRQVDVKLSTSGTTNGNTMLGLSLDLNLPTGVSVKSGDNGVLSTYLMKSGAMATASSSIIGYNSSSSKITINFTNASGIVIGEFATLTCDVAYNVAIPSVADFSVSSAKVTDGLVDSTAKFSNVSIAVSGVTVK